MSVYEIFIPQGRCLYRISSLTAEESRVLPYRGCAG